MYKRTKDDSVVQRLDDGAFVPAQNGAYREWLSGGSTPEPADVPDFAARVAAFEAKVTARLNAAAKTKGYDNIKSAALRAGYAGPFHDEGVIYAQFMDATWAKCYSVLGAVMAGQRAEPTWDEIEAELPPVPTFK